MRMHDNWTLTGYRDSGKIGPIRATVPGHVHTDLLREALIEDPLWRDNALHSQWVEQVRWEYETEFRWSGSEEERAHARLVFEGLDTIADVILNDSLIGHADNMFIAHAFAAGSRLREGANRLKVVLRRSPPIWPTRIRANTCRCSLRIGCSCGECSARSAGIGSR